MSYAKPSYDTPEQIIVQYDTHIDTNCRMCFFSSCAQIREMQISTSETEIEEHLTAVSWSISY